MAGSDVPQPEVDLAQAIPEGGMYKQEPEPGDPTSVEDRARKLDEQRDGVEPEPLDKSGS